MARNDPDERVSLLIFIEHTKALMEEDRLLLAEESLPGARGIVEEQLAYFQRQVDVTEARLEALGPEISRPV